MEWLFNESVESTRVLDPVKGVTEQAADKGKASDDNTKLFDGGLPPQSDDDNKKKKNRRRGIIIAVIIIALIIAGVVVVRTRNGKKSAGSVETKHLSRGNIEQTVSADGVVISNKTTLIDNNSGAIVRRIYAPVGTSVGQGTALCLLQDSNSNRYTTVYANGSGTVTSVSAVIGAPANGLLFTIQDTNNLVIKLTIQPEDINKVRTGMTVTATTSATDDTKYHATISRVSIVADGTEDGNSALTTQERDTTDTSTAQSAQNAGADSDAASALSSSSSGGSSAALTSASSGSSGSSDSATYTAIAPVNGNISGLHIGLKTKNQIVTSHKEKVYNVPFDAVTKDKDGNNILLVVKTSKNKDGDTVKKLQALKVSLGAQSDTAVEVMGGGLTDDLTYVLSADEHHVGETVTVK